MSIPWFDAYVNLLNGNKNPGIETDNEHESEVEEENDDDEVNKTILPIGKVNPIPGTSAQADLKEKEIAKVKDTTDKNT